MPGLNARSTILMERQAGLITRPQALSCGHEPGEIDGQVRRGYLVKVLCGTYRVAGGGRPAQQWAHACVLRCRPHARLTGEVVLGLLGVEGFSTDDPVEVLVPPGRRVTGVTFLVSEDLAPGFMVAVVCDIPAVTATRALVEVAGRITGKRLRVAIQSARWLGLTDLARLRRCALGLLPHPGAGRILALLDAGVLDPESEGECELAALLLSVEPAPELQVRVTRGRRVDFCYPDVPLIIEYLGERDHSGVDARAADLSRDRGLRRAGYHIIYVTKRDLRDPDGLLARVGAARATLLAARGTLLTAR